MSSFSCTEYSSLNALSRRRLLTPAGSALSGRGGIVDEW